MGRTFGRNEAAGAGHGGGPREGSEEVAAGTETARRAARRLRCLDALRGLTVVSMVGFHAMFDAVYVYGLAAPWFSDPAIQEAWRRSVCWVFIALAGWCTSFSRSNVRRAGRYGLAAAAVSVATYAVPVSEPINFGILFCMAGSTAAWAVCRAVAERAGLSGPAPLWLVAVLLCGFVATYGFQYGSWPVPGLAWLGFPDASFASGDYYPLLPFSLLFLSAGALAGRVRSYPDLLRTDPCPPLSWVGRHALAVYLLHQPVLIAGFEVARALGAF